VGRITYAEYMQTPDPPGGYYELRHGEFAVLPHAKHGHNSARHRIHDALEEIVGSRAEVQIALPFRPLVEFELWIVDVGVVSAERAAAVGDDEYLSGAPDLAVETLFRNPTMYELNDRMRVCLANGCQSFWVADQVKQLLSVTEGDITRHYDVDASFHCDVLDATVTVREIFE
jgi:Uma2 family endonuclease